MSSRNKKKKPWEISDNQARLYLYSDKYGKIIKNFEIIESR